MSNFTKALKELTGFGEDEVKDPGNTLSVEDVPLDKTKSLNAVEQAATKAVQAHKPEVVKAPVIQMDTINAKESATIISKAMMIQGDIQSDDDIALEGYIAGNVVTTHSFKSSGVHVGDVSADRAIFTTAKHKGNIDVKEIASIGKDAVVVGDIKCNALNLDGRVKGNLDIATEALLLDNACIIGDIATGKLNPAPGTRISGNITLRAAVQEFEDDFDFDIDFDFGGEN